MSYFYSPVAAIFKCEDCGWESESYKNALAIAKIHAQKYSHRVTGELVIYFGYDYSGIKQKTSEKLKEK